jgi:uncharacterized membrane protein YfcA
VVADLILGFVAGVVIATVTAPVGVSGAVFMLPIQLSVLAVPNPAVTPTNLLYNVIAGPGALLRYRRGGQLMGPLTRLLLAGTVPGVVLGALIRVFLLPGPEAFRIIAGLVLLTLGGWLVQRTVRPPRTSHQLSVPAVVVLAFGVGIVGGVYGIGGGSILSPILVGSGMTLVVVAPAALASTFVTSITEPSRLSSSPSSPRATSDLTGRWGSPAGSAGWSAATSAHDFNPGSRNVRCGSSSASSRWASACCTSSRVRCSDPLIGETAITSGGSGTEACAVG